MTRAPWQGKSGSMTTLPPVDGNASGRLQKKDGNKAFMTEGPEGEARPSLLGRRPKGNASCPGPPDPALTLRIDCSGASMSTDSHARCPPSSMKIHRTKRTNHDARLREATRCPIFRHAETTPAENQTPGELCAPGVQCLRHDDEVTAEEAEESGMAAGL